jgi:hypothetical protein
MALILGAALGLSRALADGGMDLPVGGARPPAPDEADPPALEPQDDGDRSPKLYDEDIPTTTDSVIFVIDRSGSMDLKVRPFAGLDGEPIVDGSRLDYVKTEIIRSIGTLPASFSFNLITFSACVESWRPGRVPATPASKAAAAEWVRGIAATGWTNTGGATSLALSDRGNRTIMLLSDGEPNFLDCGESYVGDYDTHRRVIRTANVQHASIHCFGIALDEQTRGFMQAVAADSGGSFRELDP